VDLASKEKSKTNETGITVELKDTTETNSIFICKRLILEESENVFKFESNDDAISDVFVCRPLLPGNYGNLTLKICTFESYNISSREEVHVLTSSGERIVDVNAKTSGTVH